MSEIHDLSFDIDRFLEDAARAKQQLDVERWREELRLRALRLFASRTTKLQWTRALLKLVVRELHPDDLFSELIGNLDRVPRRRWPQVASSRRSTDPRSSPREHILARHHIIHTVTADGPGPLHFDTAYVSRSRRSEHGRDP